MTPHQKAMVALMTGSWASQTVLPPRPPWMADAACLEHPEVEFIPRYTSVEENATAARGICSGCLCRAECFVYALADPTLRGIWGGTTTAERRGMRNLRAA